MSDPRNKLQKMFEPSNRYQSFGNVLTYIHVKGVRCHENTVIDIESPITAFCGLNGTGKSTLLHLAAAAYKTDIKGDYYNINDFIVAGTLDPHPFDENALIEYKLYQEDNKPKLLSLSRNPGKKRWDGYQSRSKRTVLFIKVSSYLPKIEQRDFIIHRANRIIISNSQKVDDQTREWTSKILGYDYSGIHTNTVGHSKNSGEVLVVQRSTTKYSESHMGFGEGRTLYLINSLEKLPDKSLVLLEEPEISLHPSAQHQLGQYLIDVAVRKKHQIMLTTHSEFLLNALPAKSRIYLHKGSTCIEPIPGLSSAQAKSLMTEGYHKSLCILVEDPCAKAILGEILRIEDKHFLTTVGIHVGGDKDTIATTVRTLKNTGLIVAAVRDGDMGATPSDNIFKLPGTQPPEKEIFSNQIVKDYLETTYQINFDDVFARIGSFDHHNWIKQLAKIISTDDSGLLMELARVYAKGLNESDRSTLVAQLKDTASSR